MKRNYLIIGGGTGIGQAIIEGLSQQEHINLYAASRNIKEASLPAGVQPIAYDVTGDTPLENIPDTLHGLVYCPGTINLRPFNRIKLASIREELEINYLGAVKVLHQTIDALRKSEAGSVVLYSTVAVQTGLPFHSSVSAAKGAIEGMARSLAAEYAPKVRFNVIAPSLTDTPLAGNLLSNDKKREANAERNPMKKIGTPADIAAATVFLLSEESNWITGEIMKVDGGMGNVRPL